MRTMIALILLLVAGAAQADQLTSGSCSPAIGSQAGNAKVVIHCYYSGSSVQDTYLKATHPTKLTLASVGFTRWLEDGSRPFLSVILTDDSEIPAIGTTIDVLKPGTSAHMDALKPYPVERSGIFRTLTSSGITVEANKSTTYPFLSLDDLLRKVHTDIPADFCPYDASLVAGTTPEENKAREQKSLQELLASVHDEPDRVFGPQESAQTIQEGVLLRIRYSTVFNDKITTYQLVFVNYARRGATAPLWYPSKAALAPLQCMTNEQPDIRTRS